MQPPRITVGEVNKAIKDAGYAERLVKGKGCFHFAEGDSINWPETKVCVVAIDDLRLEDWLWEHTRLRLQAEIYNCQ